MADSTEEQSPAQMAMVAALLKKHGIADAQIKKDIAGLRTAFRQQQSQAEARNASLNAVVDALETLDVSEINVGRKGIKITKAKGKKAQKKFVAVYIDE